jgi:hypothetical protein
LFLAFLISEHLFLGWNFSSKGSVGQRELTLLFQGIESLLFFIWKIFLATCDY